MSGVRTVDLIETQLVSAVMDSIEQVTIEFCPDVVPTNEEHAILTQCPDAFVIARQTANLHHTVIGWQDQKLDFTSLTPYGKQLARIYLQYCLTNESRHEAKQESHRLQIEGVADGHQLTIRSLFSQLVEGEVQTEEDRVPNEPPILERRNASI